MTDAVHRWRNTYGKYYEASNRFRRAAWPGTETARCTQCPRCGTRVDAVVSY